MGAHRLRRVVLNLAATPFFSLCAVTSVDLLALATVEQVWGPQPVLTEWLRSLSRSCLGTFAAEQVGRGSGFSKVPLRPVGLPLGMGSAGPFAGRFHDLG